jgi:hypothetical protein
MSLDSVHMGRRIRREPHAVQTAYALDRGSRKAAPARFLKRASDGDPEEAEEERRLAAQVPHQVCLSTQRTQVSF